MLSIFSGFEALRKARRWLAIPAVFGLTACDPSMMATGPVTGLEGLSGDTVEVALLLPQGSANSGDAIVAQSLENAARLAAQDVQGANVLITVYDTAGNATQAASVAAEAVNNGADVIVGPLFSEAANAVGVALSGTDIPVLSFSNNTSIAGGNVFLLGNTFQNTARRMAGYARSQGKQNVYIVHARNVAGEAGRAAVEDALLRAGLGLAGSTDYEFSQNGVFAASSSVAQGARATGADAVFLTSDAAGALPIFAQLLPENGLDPAEFQYMGLTRWDIPQLMNLPALQGGWFAISDPARTGGFANRYQLAVGSAPHPLAGLAYDGIAAIGAITQAGQKVNAASLTQGAGFQGTGGVFRFAPDGTIQRALAIATIQDGLVAILEPAPQSFGLGGS